MKSVLISIQPNWCRLIASGKKTVEVRKTRPKCETPFKCYIYCTKGNDGKYFWSKEVFEGNLGKYAIPHVGNGKVIGEFVCDEIFPIRVFENGAIQNYVCYGMEHSCVPYNEIAGYIGFGCRGYGWHISNLVIYDKPKELSEFHKVGYQETKDNVYGWTSEEEKSWQITRPPQSWCYVEDAK